MTNKPNTYRARRHPDRAAPPPPCAVCRTIITGAHMRGTTSTGETVYICPACASEAYARAAAAREEARPRKLKRDYLEGRL